MHNVQIDKQGGRQAGKQRKSKQTDFIATKATTMEHQIVF